MWWFLALIDLKIAPKQLGWGRNEWIGVQIPGADKIRLGQRESAGCNAADSLKH